MPRIRKTDAGIIKCWNAEIKNKEGKLLKRHEFYGG